MPSRYKHCFPLGLLADAGFGIYRGAGFGKSWSSTLMNFGAWLRLTRLPLSAPSLTHRCLSLPQKVSLSLSLFLVVSHFVLSHPLASRSIHVLVVFFAFFCFFTLHCAFGARTIWPCYTSWQARFLPYQVVLPIRASLAIAATWPRAFLVFSALSFWPDSLS